MGGLVRFTVSNFFVEVVGGVRNGRKVTYPLPGTQGCLAAEEEAEVPLVVVVVVFPFANVFVQLFR